MSLPGNQRKLEAADALASLAEQADLSPIHLALAFILTQPAITAPIIGPRTMEQLESQLPGLQETDREFQGPGPERPGVAPARR